MEPRISVSTIVRPWEDPEKVVESIRRLFPEWKVEFNIERGEFPCEKTSELIHGEAASLDVVLNQCSKQRILDTALDVMTMDLEADSTVFDLSRQAANGGKVSFVLDENTLGGRFSVSVSGEDLGLWLEQKTWHEGRNTIPRSHGDDLSMKPDGEPSEWFDRQGRPTLNQEED